MFIPLCKDSGMNFSLFNFFCENMRPPRLVSYAYLYTTTFAVQIFRELERSNQYALRYCVSKSRNAEGISQLGVNKLSLEVNCKFAKCV